MCQSFVRKKDDTIPLFVVDDIRKCALTSFESTWVKNQPQDSHVYLIPNEAGALQKIICVSLQEDMWAGAAVYDALRHLNQSFYLSNHEIDGADFALSWGLAGYNFYGYKSQPQRTLGPKLYVAPSDFAFVSAQYDAVCLARDLINAPASVLTPRNLANKASGIGKTYGARTDIIEGDDLKKSYPMVWAVGRASEHPPALVDLKWGNPDHPKVTLIGKGVTFDSGGLDIKPPNAMLLMKKDMGGAAQALALAQMIMVTECPVSLRLILPCAENSVGSRSFRPSDILTSRQGVTVEVGDTDAEGRLLLADALTAASEDRPDYILDFATLTGAARVAVGTEIGALFSNHSSLQDSLMSAADNVEDPLCALPLWKDYLKLLKSNIADTKSCSAGGYAGAITAALFLQKFVGNDIKWAHFDVMAWNVSSRPGRPVGGEAMGIRAAYEFISKL